SAASATARWSSSWGGTAVATESTFTGATMALSFALNDHVLTQKTPQVVGSSHVKRGRVHQIVYSDRLRGLSKLISHKNNRACGAKLPNCSRTPLGFGRVRFGASSDPPRDRES